MLQKLIETMPRFVYRISILQIKNSCSNIFWATLDMRNGIPDVKYSRNFQIVKNFLTNHTNLPVIKAYKHILNQDRSTTFNARIFFELGKTCTALHNRPYADGLPVVFTHLWWANEKSFWLRHKHLSLQTLYVRHIVSLDHRKYHP